ncbi:hypothetical protein [Nitrosomonas ureae]|nr:hypothetical protein [Nitrosomonas ureae]
MHVNNCDEGGTCDWKLACSLGNQQAVEFITNSEANTNEFIEINRVLTQKEFPPVTVSCSAWEHDGGIGAEWETVGSRSLVVNTTGPHLIKLSSSEGEVTVNFVVEAIGSTGQPLTENNCSYGPDTCVQGFVWREAGPNDYVCVTPQVRDQTRADNAQANARRSPNGGLYGPDTCLSGYVWREAFPGDHVCVTPETRTQAAEDNTHASARDACK